MTRRTAPAPGTRRAARRWTFRLGALVLAALLAALIVPWILPEEDDPLSSRLPQNPGVRIVERLDQSRPGRRRVVLVVVPLKDALLPDSPAIMESLARLAARRALRDDALDAVEIRLRRGDGQEVLRLRMSAAADGWDGTEGWRILVLSRGE